MWFVAVFVIEYFPATKHIISKHIMRARKIKSQLRIFKKKIKSVFLTYALPLGKTFFPDSLINNLEIFF